MTIKFDRIVDDIPCINTRLKITKDGLVSLEI
ncbi:MAG: hypothetical protein ACI9O5_003249, partial [Algoriphagus sp.]